MRALRASRRADQAAAQFGITRNPVFLWAAIKAITEDSFEEAHVRLPNAVRTYLHEVASQITDAAIGPSGEFLESATKALGFGGISGQSKAEAYATTHDASNLLSIFEVLKERFGSAGRAHMEMALVLNIGAPAVEDRLSDARRHLREVQRLLSWSGPIRLNNAPFRDLPTPALFTLLRGLPSIAWTKAGIAGARASKANGKTPPLKQSL
ncbi:hypothetical protein ACE7GA_01415 [Roseomonas sp. CCTCC AB2023176]|uniref:hypothetical protein n=1 Tax=Roseomonas sp. CCTCC AB2023176 TaxID=3342640 RepID=UPI0035D86DC6